MAVRKLVRPRPPIEHDTHISDALLLKLVRKQEILVMRAGPPVDGARRITGMILAHTKEIRPCTTHPGWNQARVNTRAAWMECHMTKAQERREDEQLALRLHLDRMAGQPKRTIDLRPNRFESISTARTRDLVLKGVG